MSVTRDPQPGGWARRRLSPRLDLALVLVLGFALRLGLVLHSAGGIRGNVGYDASVYYTAADALIHGRLPYRDFLLLHPPALPLTLTPFAALGLVTSDHLGFVVANTVFEAAGAFNGVLVVLIARRAGLGRGAALGGGLFYALWLGSAGSEISIRLEPFGNAFLLLAFLLLQRARTSPRARRLHLLVGACLGIAALTKIWWGVPLLVVVLALALTRRRRGDAIPVVLGAAVVGAPAMLPFVIAAPRATWRMIVLDQLDRHHIKPGLFERVSQISGASSIGVLLVVVVASACVAMTWCTAVHLRTMVLVGVAQFAVLMLSPIYLYYYSDYIAPCAALVVAGALHGTSTRSARAAWATWAGRAAAATAVIAVTVAMVRNLDEQAALVTPLPQGRTLAAGVHGYRCIMADSPMALIDLDVLSRTLAAGCPNWVDVSGRTYDVDRPAGARYVQRPRNKAWQHALAHYLFSGDAVVVIRGATGFGHRLRVRINRLPVIARGGRMVVHRVR